MKHPNSNIQPPEKIQQKISNAASNLELGSLELFWMLEFGCWMFFVALSQMSAQNPILIP
jgi:hypothetical protein